MDIIIQSDDPIQYAVFRDYLGYEEDKMTKEEKNNLKKFVKKMREIDK